MLDLAVDIFYERKIPSATSRLEILEINREMESYYQDIEIILVEYCNWLALHFIQGQACQSTAGHIST